MNRNFFTPANHQQTIGKIFYSNWALIDQQRVIGFGHNPKDLWRYLERYEQKADGKI